MPGSDFNLTNKMNDEMIPSYERRARRARTILRTHWQGYDAAGHSLGRSRTCGLLEVAMGLLGAPDPSESSAADHDLTPLLDEAREWMHAIRTREMEEHFRSLDEGSSPTSERIAKEIESGFENRMR